MNEHRYILQPYNGMSSRYHCPECKHKDKTFVRYIDTETGGHIAEDIGKCNRKDKCGYHKPPPLETECFFVPFDLLNDYNDKAYQIITTEKTFYLPKSQVYEILERGCYVSQWYLNEGNNRSKPIFFTNDRKSFSKGEAVTTTRTTVILKAAPKPVSFIPVEVFKQSLKSHNENNFVKFLLSLFGSEITCQLISRYFIGTSKHWQGGTTVFWYIDIKGNVNYGKLMFYNIIECKNSIIGKDCKRDKKRNNHCASVLQNELNEANKPLPEWLVKYQSNESKINCFYAEHLLRDKTKPVAIFEAPKTAIIASVYLPQFICIAADNKGGLNANKCKVLAGRNVALFPDLNGFELWSQKAKELSHLARFNVSDLLERKASEAEKKQGLDLADYLIRFDYKQFALQETINKPVTALQNNLLNIHSADILNSPISMNLDKEFNQSAIVTAITTTGIIEILRNKNGQLLQPENERLVNDISNFFAKQFQAGTLDSVPCYIHQLN